MVNSGAHRIRRVGPAGSTTTAGSGALMRFLALLLLASPVAADTRLPELLRGTAHTPALSGLQVTLLERGKVVESHALGIARITDGEVVALRRDHKVRVASISKLLVALGIMRLVETSRLDLDTDVSDYLGWQLRNPAFPAQAITVRQLLSHTSSIRDGDRYFIAAGRGALRDFFDPASEFWDQGRHFATREGEAPGRFFTYANLNFGVLGELIEGLSGQRFDQYMTKEVLSPLGLTASFNPCDVGAEYLATAFRKRDAAGAWNTAGDWVAQVDGSPLSCFYGAAELADPDAFLAGYAPGRNASLFSPQGGLRASADDLATVLGMLAARGAIDRGRLLSERSVQDMLRPSWILNSRRDNGNSAGEAEPGGPTAGLMTAYGLSVHLIDMRAWGFDKGPARLVGHLGEAYGVLSHALLDPETGDGIVSIITGTADDPARSPPGHSPLYRVEEELLRWWVTR